MSRSTARSSSCDAALIACGRSSSRTAIQSTPLSVLSKWLSRTVVQTASKVSTGRTARVGVAAVGAAVVVDAEEDAVEFGSALCVSIAADSGFLPTFVGEVQPEVVATARTRRQAEVKNGARDVRGIRVRSMDLQSVGFLNWLGEAAARVSRFGRSRGSNARSRCNAVSAARCWRLARTRERGRDGIRGAARRFRLQSHSLWISEF